MTLLAASAGVALLLWIFFLGVTSRGRRRDEILSDPIGCGINGVVLIILLGVIWRSVT